MVDPIFNLFKVKYTTLDELKILGNNKKKTVIYIDLEIVFKYLYTKRVNDYLITCDDKADTQINLMSNIINLAQHYRLYCTKYKRPNVVILYWNKPNGDKPYINSKYISQYREYYDNKLYRRETCSYLRNRMEAILPSLNIILKYVNEVYMYYPETIESSLIPYILFKKYYDNDDTQNIIVTDDKYGFQYVNKGFTVLVPDKENSIILNQTNVIEYIKKSYDLKSINTVPSNYTGFIISMLGNKYRNIPKVNGVGIGTLIKYINDGIDKFTVTPNTTNISMLEKILPEDIRETFVNNYHCTDLHYQYSDLGDSDIFKVVNQLIDKFDDNTLLSINDKYFKNHPLMLINMKRDQILSDY